MSLNRSLHVALGFLVISGLGFSQDSKPAAEVKKDPAVENYEKAIKDLKRIEGPFPMYQRKKELLMELSEANLGKLWMIQASFHTGLQADGVQAGFPAPDFAIDVFRWDKNDDKVWLVEPNIKYRWPKDSQFAVAAQRSFPEAIIGSFSIEQTNPEKKLMLVNVTSLFLGDALRVNEAVTSALGGPYMLDREKSNPEKVRGFPENTIVQMKLHFFSPRGGDTNPLLAALGLASKNQLEDSRSAPIKITYNMWWRKEDGYRPRLSDPRVGFFTTDFYDVSKFLEDDRTQRYIWRFNLQKKDPKAALSDPVKPIVWTLDNSIPPKYRDAVREGVLRWNKAFEALGYKNAVQVQNAPNDPDFDHADGRYNVIRWAVSEDSAYAIAMARTDPITGEILNASVLLDANMIQFIFNEQQKISTPAASAMTKAMALFTTAGTAGDKLSQEIWGEQQVTSDHLSKFGFRAQDCQLGMGMADSAHFGWTALNAMGAGLKISRDEYAKQFVSDAICHEVGHTLGLRHNFVGSTSLSTEELGNEAVTKKVGLTSSVMDYVPTNIVAVLKGTGSFFNCVIGSYDKWAIQYGYSDPKGASSEEERASLSQIARLSGEPGHGYMSDEAADSWNPFVVRFDNAKDPLNYSAKAFEAAQRVKKYALSTLPLPGQDFARRTDALTLSYSKTFREGRFSSRFIGGLIASRNFKGDSGQGSTLAPVDAMTQRQAARLIADRCFTVSSLDVPATVLGTLSTRMTSDSAGDWVAPFREYLSTNEMALYSSVMALSVIQRIQENEFKTPPGADRYGIEEHYKTFVQPVFAEIFEGKSVGPVRRDLQRFALNGLIAQATTSVSSAGDAKLLSTSWLKTLNSKISAQLRNTKGLDSITILHLTDMNETIKRFLNRLISVTR